MLGQQRAASCLLTNSSYEDQRTMNRWLRDPAWQAIGALATLLGIPIGFVLLVPEARQLALERWPLALVALGALVFVLILLIPPIREDIHSGILRVFQMSQQLLGSLVGKIVLVGVGYLSITVLIPRLLKLSFSLHFELILWMTVATFMFVVLVGYTLIQEIKRHASKQQIQAVQSELAYLRRSLYDLELGPVLRKWPQFLQVLSENPGDSVMASLIGAGTVVGWDESAIVVAVPEMLKEAIERLNADRLTPLLHEVYGEPYKLKFVSASEESPDGTEQLNGTGR